MTFGPKRGCVLKPRAGLRVRFTAYFLSQVPRADTTTWTVVECMCGLCKCGKHVAVNEPPPRDEMYEGSGATRAPWRHIHFTNLEIAPIRAEDDAMPTTPRRPR